jgi:hypothetical protein
MKNQIEKKSRPESSNRDFSRIELKANMGYIFKGEYSALNEFSERLENLVLEIGVQIVYKHASTLKLWIKEGGELK